MARAYFRISDRLGFSTWTEDDFSLAMGLWGDPRVTMMTGGQQTPQQVRERLLLEIDRLQNYGVQYWPIFTLGDGAHVGCCGLRPRDAEKHVFELGYQLRHDCWRQGYGSEAAKAVVAHAFTVTGANALYAGHHPRSEGSKKILTGLGFRYTHDEFYPPTRQMEPCYLLGKEDYAFL